MFGDESLEFLERGRALPGARVAGGQMLNLTGIDHDLVIPWSLTAGHQRGGRDQRGPQDQELDQGLPEESFHTFRLSLLLLRR